MSSAIVRGHRPQTLDDVGNLAVPHMGHYGEGYGVGLAEAMRCWGGRGALHGVTAATVATRSGGLQQSGLGEFLNNG
ncbi:hypothetical protein PHMEG_00022470 [Phytophthora megakarya]|uniref:Uncharacterized protein n=1 Tax=Phytophthora megakarya TaxID=4795 RepID=A0A225VJ42_9STRA|nr:hypothetical protein PHMEG_00022470 [Phytophthora megakarya]